MKEKSFERRKSMKEKKWYKLSIEEQGHEPYIIEFYTDDLKKSLEQYERNRFYLEAKVIDKNYEPSKNNP